MPDNKYTQNKKECTEKIRTRIKTLKTGETILASELLWIAHEHGLGMRYLEDLLIPFTDFRTITIGYKDGRPYTITKEENH